MSDNRILVLGAGPKGIAIAAKAKCLAFLGWKVPEVIVLDRQQVAAHWTGGFGYTDGEQPLGTPPEKDVGFPYSSVFGPLVDREMLGYSWQAFLVEDGGYSDWVDRGRPHPPHRRWGEYLAWVADKAGLGLVVGDVTGIATQRNSWKLTYRTSGRTNNVILGSALVITGPGDPLTTSGQPPHHSRIFDGQDFWQDLDLFSGLEEVNIGILGSGETAAAIVVELVQRVNRSTGIVIVNRQGAVFSRGESFDENRVFSDPSAWQDMGPEERRELVKRTDRGVFSLHTKRIIDHAENVKHEMLDVSTIKIERNSILVAGKYGRVEKNRKFDYLIIATGFDPLWFRRLTGSRLRGILASKRRVEGRIGEDLSVSGVRPKLHLPMLAGFKQGPGFPNLSCLSAVSDRILQSYVSKQK